jgi:hypothetical protein
MGNYRLVLAGCRVGANEKVGEESINAGPCRTNQLKIQVTPLSKNENGRMPAT